MVNGKIDEAEVDVILSGGQEDINRFMVTTLLEIRKRVDATRTVGSFLSRCRVELSAFVAIAVAIIALVIR